MNNERENQSDRNLLQRKEAFQAFSRYLTDHGLKHSRQRETILRFFLDTDGHLTADDLYRLIHYHHPEIGRTTIYRTLKLLCEAKLAEPIELKDGLIRFEHRFGLKHHDHMICSDCGIILEFRSAEIEKLQSKIAESFDFTIDSHRLQLFGVCRNCRRSRYGEEFLEIERGESDGLSSL